MWRRKRKESEAMEVPVSLWMVDAAQHREVVVRPDGGEVVVTFYRLSGAGGHTESMITVRFPAKDATTLIDALTEARDHGL